MMRGSPSCLILQSVANTESSSTVYALYFSPTPDIFLMSGGSRTKETKLLKRTTILNCWHFRSTRDYCKLILKLKPINLPKLLF